MADIPHAEVVSETTAATHREDASEEHVSKKHRHKSSSEKRDKKGK
jgi:hypothetical protein